MFHSNHNEIITLNVSGTIIQVPKNLLSELEYFKELLNTDNNEIFINYSPMLFDHMLSFLRDPLYLFPRKHVSTLDYFKIPYDVSKLYDKKYKNCKSCGIFYSVISIKNKNFCNKCVCIFSDCDKESHEKSQYCLDHICQYGMCNDNIYINGYCENHICNYNGCSDGCLLSQKYCRNHLCKSHLCGSTIFQDDAECCEKHKCIYSLDCYNVKKETSNYCENHSCSYLGCQNNIFTELSTICKEHECQYNNCHSMMHNNKIYCFNHMCRYNYCESHIEPGTKSCEIHKCTYKNCTDAKYKSDYCYYHTCGERNCNNFALSYCSLHKCAYSECNNFVCSPGKWCDNHICEHDNCENFKILNSLYCPFHIVIKYKICVCMITAFGILACIKAFKN